MKNNISILIIFLTTVACDPCSDCDSVTYEPTVSFVFINQDSIAKLNTLITLNESTISSIDALLNSLDASETSKIDSLNQIRTSTDSLNTVYRNTQTTINSGLLKVDQVALVGTGNTLTYTDSASAWSIPLSYDGSLTQYEVTIAGLTETIELSYDNVQEVDEQRNVLIRAENIRVVNEPYDSLINCEENCIDGEAMFTFYF